jgi:hypothetical protein
MLHLINPCLTGSAPLHTPVRGSAFIAANRSLPTWAIRSNGPSCRKPSARDRRQNAHHPCSGAIVAQKLGVVVVVAVAGGRIGAVAHQDHGIPIANLGCARDATQLSQENESSQVRTTCLAALACSTSSKVSPRSLAVPSAAACWAWIRVTSGRMAGTRTTRSVSAQPPKGFSRPQLMVRNPLLGLPQFL